MWTTCPRLLRSSVSRSRTRNLLIASPTLPVAALRPSPLFVLYIDLEMWTFLCPLNSWQNLELIYDAVTGVKCAAACVRGCMFCVVCCQRVCMSCPLPSQLSFVSSKVKLNYCCSAVSVFLALDAFVRTNRHAIAMMFVHLSVCLGQVCIVIIWCTLAQIWVHRWIVQCSGHPDTKASPPIRSRLFQFHLEERWCMDVQTRPDISRTVEDRG